MKAFFFSFLILIFLISSCASPSNSPSTPSSVQLPTPSQVVPSEPSPNTPIVEINLVAKQFAFEPAEIRVHLGDHVKIHAKSIDVSHGFGLREFNINEDLNPGEEKLIEFTADKIGTFTFYCSVPCGSGHRTMKGQLIVE